MELIGRSEAVLRILKLPPELVPNDRNFGGTCRHTCVFHRMDDARRRQKQHNDN
jgi:hypothetical protein